MSVSKEEQILDENGVSRGKEILEDRELSINIKEIYENLKNLDYSKVIWRNVFAAIIFQIFALYGQYLSIVIAQWKTILFFIVVMYYSGIGLAMGGHRLWSHRSYKATFPLRLFLIIGQTLGYQHDVLHWCRLHRVHHKYSETSADPHDAKRGLFFAHMGWMMYESHPDCIKRLKEVDDSDLLSDPLVMFQHNYYHPLAIMLSYVIPMIIPWYFWNESLVVALMVCGFQRHVYSLHFTYTVNSLAHWTGLRPYDNTMYPSENKLVAFLTAGDGWHNFHHVFPFDYRTSEFSGNFRTNFNTQIIDFCAKLGLAYDLRKASDNVILQRKKRTGSLFKSALNGGM